MSLFEKGRPKTGGRRKGSRDRIATALLEAIAKDFEAHGEQAVKICRLEEPTQYLRVVASLLPRELEVTHHNSLRDLTDDELEIFVAQLRAERATAGSIDDGTPETAH